MNRSYRIAPILLMVSMALIALSQLDGFAAGGDTLSKIFFVSAIVLFISAALSLALAQKSVGKGEKSE
jgi:hypothetical protein